MDIALAELLTGQTPATRDSTVWGGGAIRLCVCAYLSTGTPPLSHITSVRGLVCRDDELLVIRDDRDDPHILPGGRRVSGESLEETLRREMLEETGVIVSAVAPLGFIHFHHTSPRPPDYSYPYPDFLQAVYLAQYEGDRPGDMVPDEYVTRADFLPMAVVDTLRLPPAERVFLQAGLEYTWRTAVSAEPAGPADRAFHCSPGRSVGPVQRRT